MLSSDPSLTERMIIMVSWNDLFTFVIMLVAILTYIDTHRKHKEIAVLPLVKSGNGYLLR